jgi:hypothetical protein
VNYDQNQVRPSNSLTLTELELYGTGAAMAVPTKAARRANVAVRKCILAD